MPSTIRPKKLNVVSSFFLLSSELSQQHDGSGWRCFDRRPPRASDDDDDDCVVYEDNGVDMLLLLSSLLIRHVVAMSSQKSCVRNTVDRVL